MTVNNLTEMAEEKRALWMGSILLAIETLEELADECKTLDMNSADSVPKVAKLRPKTSIPRPRMPPILISVIAPLLIAVSICGLQSVGS